MSFEQDQLLLPFARLLAFQPVITGDSPAPDAVPQTAALHRAGALPHGITVLADRHWERAWRLDQEGPLPQVPWSSEAAVIRESYCGLLLFLTKAPGQGDRCGCNGHEQPQPELRPCGGLWEQRFQGLCVLLAPA